MKKIFLLLMVAVLLFTSCAPAPEGPSAQEIAPTLLTLVNYVNPTDMSFTHDLWIDKKEGNTSLQITSVPVNSLYLDYCDSDYLYQIYFSLQDSPSIDPYDGQGTKTGMNDDYHEDLTNVNTYQLTSYLSRLIDDVKYNQICADELLRYERKGVLHYLQLDYDNKTWVLEGETTYLIDNINGSFSGIQEFEFYKINDGVHSYDLEISRNYLGETYIKVNGVFVHNSL